MLKYLKVSDSLFLVQYTHAKQVAVTAAKEPTHYVLIFDRSGSMYNDIKQVVRDVKKVVRKMNENDIVTIGWFSGYGQKKFQLVESQVTASYLPTVDEKLDGMASVIGLTCFSEILSDVAEIIKDSKKYTPRIALCFFTDGEPTVGNPAQERKAILTALDNIKADLTTSLLIGYGNYYNKTLMTDMAEHLGGSLTHSGAMDEFLNVVNDFLVDTKSSTKKIKLKLDIPYDTGADKYLLAFSVNGPAISILAQEPNQEVLFTLTDQAEDHVYVITKQPPPKAEQVKLTQADVRTKGPHESLVRGLYAAAFTLSQTGKTDLAIDALAIIGDKHLVNTLSNSFTPAEYGRAEKELVVAIHDEKGRYLEGYVENPTPKADAFCLLDLIDLLQDDEEAYFYPVPLEKSYKRIGAKTKAVEAAPKFMRKANVKTRFNNPVWHDTMLNLSISAVIEGKVSLIGEYNKHGFAKFYPTHRFKNYTLVKDGFLNVNRLPVSVSKATFDKLKTEGVIPADKRYHLGSIYELQLDKIPVINRKAVPEEPSAVELARNVWRELELKGQLKALKFLRDEVSGKAAEEDHTKKVFDHDKEEFLAQNFIGRNGFSPKVEKVESTDFYQAKEFDIKVAKFSSLPSVNAVRKKLEAGKNLTPSEELVNAGLELFIRTGPIKGDADDKLHWLNKKIAEILPKQRLLSREIQETKFAVLLGKKWPVEFATRNDNEIVVDGHKFTFAIREVQVAC